MKFKNFSDCAIAYLNSLNNQERFSTHHVYSYALSSFFKYEKTKKISWTKINKENLKNYEIYLKNRKSAPNTISAYIRMIRCIYNKGVESESVRYIPRLFSSVYTAVESIKKKAIPQHDIKKLLCNKVCTTRAIETQNLTKLMFQFCGMPFVDLAHLKESNISGEVLSYNRKKQESL